MFAVINHLHLSKPVAEFRPGLEQEGLSLLAGLPGFRDFYFVQEAEDRAAVIILWASADDAANGAKTFGPTWFAKHIAPYLASEQQRSMGRLLCNIRGRLQTNASGIFRSLRSLKMTFNCKS